MYCVARGDVTVSCEASRVRGICQTACGTGWQRVIRCTFYW